MSSNSLAVTLPILFVMNTGEVGLVEGSLFEQPTREQHGLWALLKMYLFDAFRLSVLLHCEPDDIMMSYMQLPHKPYG